MKKTKTFVVKNYSMPKRIADLIDYWSKKTGSGKSEFVRDSVKRNIGRLIGDKTYDN